MVQPGSSIQLGTKVLRLLVAMPGSSIQLGTKVLRPPKMPLGNSLLRALRTFARNWGPPMLHLDSKIPPGLSGGASFTKRMLGPLPSSFSRPAIPIAKAESVRSSTCDASYESRDLALRLAVTRLKARLSLLN